MNIFKLAILQLGREKINTKNIKYDMFMLERAITIKKFINMQYRNKKVAVNRYKKLVVV